MEVTVIRSPKRRKTDQRRGRQREEDLGNLALDVEQGGDEARELRAAPCSVVHGRARLARAGRAVRHRDRSFTRAGGGGPAAGERPELRDNQRWGAPASPVIQSIVSSSEATV